MNDSDYQLDTYDFTLPEELIAQQPVEPRDAARLLVVHRATGSWEHRNFRDLPEYLDANDLMVVNNTRVIKARLLGRRLLEQRGRLIPGGKVEFLLLEQLRPCVWEGMFHASVKHKPGVIFEVPTSYGTKIRGKLLQGASSSAHGTVVAEFDQDPVSVGAGVMPLPPYIKRKAAAEDETFYQTLYAKMEGSAAAPTAGLHFTDRVFEDLRSQGVGWEEVTLHVGLGTFRPVKTSDIRLHPMHDERFEIASEVAEHLTMWKAQSKRILAVGTTSVRTLESAWIAEELRFQPGIQKTSIFIYPGGRRICAVNRMLTNFHLPKSTLLMLVSAFAGRELTLSAYKDAVRQKYRFFSYGDAMLIL
jgi:S-adenosylmethionine:tRNA ribosyltransferase-isomerase